MNLECSFELPVKKDTLVAELRASIEEGKQVTAVVRKKEDALMKYDDSNAGGYSGVYGQRDTKSSLSDILSVKIGNLRANQSCTISL